MKTLGPLLCCVLVWAWTPAPADWAGFSRYGEVAEVAVESGEVRLDLRIATQAAPQGAAMPKAAPGAIPAWLGALLPKLSSQQGHALPLALRSLERIEAESQGGPAHYHAVLSYPVNGPLGGLAILPPQDPGLATGLVVLHRGVPTADLAPLQKPLKLSLDWADPWRSHFDDPERIRRHAEPRSYLYIEPYEVRHEALLRLKDLGDWVDLGLRDPRYVEDGEREALRRRLGAFLLQRNPLAIDGAEASPQVDRVEFLRYDRTGVLPVNAPGRLETDSLMVGAVLAYLTDQPARTVALRWDLFGEGLQTRPISLISGQETFDGYANPKQPEYLWTQDEALEPAPADEKPVAAIFAAPTATLSEKTVLGTALLASLVVALAFALHTVNLPRRRYADAGLGLLCIAAFGLVLHPRPVLMAGGGSAEGKLDGAQAKALLQALLHNAYRAFQVRDEEKAYDRLARSLDGGLLDETYLQQRRALLRQAQGLGGEGKVDRVEVLESRAQFLDGSAPAWQVDSRWMAHGTISHWGHSHERHNLYQARLTLRPAEGGVWKIARLEFQGGQRLEPGALQ